MMEVFEQLPGENAKHYAKRALLYNLVNLEMKPGDKITESDLCELYGISRTPIREAILELHQQNMIDIYPKQGTFVSYIDTAAIDEFLELRNLMEQSVHNLHVKNLHLIILHIFVKILSSGNIISKMIILQKHRHVIKNSTSISIVPAASSSGII